MADIFFPRYPGSATVIQDLEPLSPLQTALRAQRQITYGNALRAKNASTVSAALQKAKERNQTAYMQAVKLVDPAKVGIYEEYVSIPLNNWITKSKLGEVSFEDQMGYLNEALSRKAAATSALEYRKTIGDYVTKPENMMYYNESAPDYYNDLFINPSGTIKPPKEIDTQIDVQSLYAPYANPEMIMHDYYTNTLQPVTKSYSNIAPSTTDPENWQSKFEYQYTSQGGLFNKKGELLKEDDGLVAEEVANSLFGGSRFGATLEMKREQLQKDALAVAKMEIPDDVARRAVATQLLEENKEFATFKQHNEFAETPYRQTSSKDADYMTKLAPYREIINIEGEDVAIKAAGLSKEWGDLTKIETVLESGQTALVDVTDIGRDEAGDFYWRGRYQEEEDPKWAIDTDKNVLRPKSEEDIEGKKIQPKRAEREMGWKKMTARDMSLILNRYNELGGSFDVWGFDTFREQY